MADDCNVAQVSKDLIAKLLQGESFDLPESDISDIDFDLDPSVFPGIKKLTNEDLTEGTLDGNGTFDILARAIKVQLAEEFDRGRITGAEYSKSYIAMMGAAMGNAVQFLLGRDNAFWAAQKAQVEVMQAKVEFEASKLRYAVAAIEAKAAKAGYALTKIKLATESKAFCIAAYNLEHMLPAQKMLVDEQIETQRGSTLDKRRDGIDISGSIGRQNLLNEQQTTSYKRADEAKVAKIFTDAWTVQKTIDEGLLAPEQFKNDYVNQVLVNLREAVGFDITVIPEEEPAP